MAEEINITGLDMIKHLEDEEQTAEVTGLEFIKSDAIDIAKCQEEITDEYDQEFIILLAGMII